jgi:multicomponent Na+:H+ antiporter subunit C
VVPPCAEKADHTTRASALIRRTATLAGLGLVAVAAVSIFIADPAHADPVPQAMVLTGIVVAVAATSVALGMALRVAARTGRPYLDEDQPPEDRA